MFSGCGALQTYCFNKYPNGNPKFQGKMTPIGGNKDGYWAYFYEDGKIKAGGNYKLNQMNGLWTCYYPTGGMYKQQEFKFSYFNVPNPNGPYKQWSEEGNLIIQGQFENSSMTGLWEFWNTKGVKVMEIEFSDNLPNGYCNMWYSSPGKEGNKKIQCSFRKGRHGGKYTAWYGDGKLRVEATLDRGSIVDVQMYDKDGATVLDEKSSQKIFEKQLEADLELLREVERDI